MVTPRAARDGDGVPEGVADAVGDPEEVADPDGDAEADGVADADWEAEAEGVADAVGLADADPDGVAEADGVAEPEPDGVVEADGVTDPEDVCDADGVAVAEGVAELEGVAEGVAVDEADGVAEAEGVAVGVAVGVGVPEAEDVAEAEDEGVTDGVAVADGVRVALGVGSSGTTSRVSSWVGPLVMVAAHAPASNPRRITRPWWVDANPAPARSRVTVVALTTVQDPGTTTAEPSLEHRSSDSQGSRKNTWNPASLQFHTGALNTATRVKGLWSYRPGPLAVALITDRVARGAKVRVTVLEAVPVTPVPVWVKASGTATMSRSAPPLSVATHRTLNPDPVVTGVARRSRRKGNMLGVTLSLGLRVRLALRLAVRLIPAMS
jgi:hypothetical protein